MEDSETLTEPMPVLFSGDAREYFGIWIVNVLLSIVTVGIYSAWAKVRTQKYFLGNTMIDGRPFSYHATGAQILIGRIIVLAILFMVGVISETHPIAYIVTTILFAFVSPWLINRGLSFNAAMTSWSNVRFRFVGNYWRALLVFVIYPFLSIVTLWIAFPFAARALARYTIGGHSLGSRKLAFDSRIRPFYKALLIVVLWILIGVVPVVILALAAVADASNLTLLMAVFVAVYFLQIKTVFAAGTRNAIFEGMELENGHRFVSNISPTRLILIVLTNTLAIIGTAGLLLPWAKNTGHAIPVRAYVGCPQRLARRFCHELAANPVGNGGRFHGLRIH